MREQNGFSILFYNKNLVQNFFFFLLALVGETIWSFRVNFFTCVSRCRICFDNEMRFPRADDREIWLRTFCRWLDFGLAGLHISVFRGGSEGIRALFGVHSFGIGRVLIIHNDNIRL